MKKVFEVRFELSPLPALFVTTRHSFTNHLNQVWWPSLDPAVTSLPLQLSPHPDVKSNLLMSDLGPTRHRLSNAPSPVSARRTIIVKFWNVRLRNTISLVILMHSQFPEIASIDLSFPGIFVAIDSTKQWNHSVLLIQVSSQTNIFLFLFYRILRPPTRTLPLVILETGVLFHIWWTDKSQINEKIWNK